MIISDMFYKKTRNMNSESSLMLLNTLVTWLSRQKR